MKLSKNDVQALRNWAKNEEKLSLEEDIVQVLKDAERPLMLDEIIDHVEALREWRKENE